MLNIIDLILLAIYIKLLSIINNLMYIIIYYIYSIYL